MASLSVPGMRGWRKPYFALPGARGLAPSYRRGRRAPFFVAPLGALALRGRRRVRGGLMVETHRT